MAGVPPWLDDFLPPALGEGDGEGALDAALWLTLSDFDAVAGGQAGGQAACDDGQGAWRCLDATHGGECALCAPPPEAGQERLWALAGGGAGGAPAVALLRSQLSGTAEWCGEERTRLVRCQGRSSLGSR